MDESKLKELLEDIRDGRCELEAGLSKLKKWPMDNIDYARLDHHRCIRTGFPEVVFGENKSAEQIYEILKRMLEYSKLALATRVDKDKAKHVCENLSEMQYHETARMLTPQEGSVAIGSGQGMILVVSAGTSDIPVAEEAFVTAKYLGNKVEKLYDVGVAGMHRLLSHREVLEKASVFVVVAGMEGALPSVVGGLVGKPIIAVPTSVGYGAGFGGIAALLGMLNSCAPGVAVVNIDNGFGAGCMASAINKVNSGM